MARITLNRKWITAGSLVSLALTFYIIFGNHTWFQTRAPLEMDLAELNETNTGEAVLERYRALELRCDVQQTALGAQVCGAFIESFNGIPARHVAFYFDAVQDLTAWKLTVPGESYPTLLDHLEERFGPPEPGNPNDSAKVQHINGGVLALEDPALRREESVVIWIRDQE
ncbi:hypothetical protein CAI21_14690 [Alkalilimnicola ehrlichii]|uniref:Uncharacterized protein n=1 Tax=Alkalilimnicola ehrlichii TaxID=351052 RepID=A0A3E0WQY0_9GAMM|nr:hypothetical protein [Alkalilimnicola ehrlichii]RFA27287.1 hypothetical protein CAI21_14690 [Alkalilimnicola ehrlichii]RFA34396.1 hypothetical protein CAL65_15260 [Alkalilimnicola ehrlichii]